MIDKGELKMTKRQKEQIEFDIKNLTSNWSDERFYTRKEHKIAIAGYLYGLWTMGITTKEEDNELTQKYLGWTNE